MTLKSQQVRTGGLWSTDEQKLHINCLELTAVLVAVKSFAKDRMSINTLVRTDNLSARAYINHLGGTHSHPMNTVATELWKWCISKNIFLITEHLPCMKNLVADKESCTVRDCCNWMIHPHLFMQINKIMGPLEVDLFASLLTHQLPDFFS